MEDKIDSTWVGPFPLKKKKKREKNNKRGKPDI